MLWNKTPQKRHIPQEYFISLDSYIIRLSHNYQKYGEYVKSFT